MKHPNRIHLSASSVFNVTRAVVEDPYTEPLITLYGRVDDSTINVRGAYNWTSAERTRENSDVSNGRAEDRIIAFEEAVRAFVVGKSFKRISRLIGGAHSHPDSNDGTVPVPSPSRGDRKAFLTWMDAYNCPFWVELILIPELKTPRGLGVSYRRVADRPVLSISNMYKGFGIDITFSGHYTYKNSKLRVRELPIDFDPKTVRRYFTTE
ncbi:MAG TPA: hypothetical protein VJB05_01480 [archaeon]|nr:hypothetical protein [archaeon]